MEQKTYKNYIICKPSWPIHPMLNVVLFILRKTIVLYCSSPQEEEKYLKRIKGDVCIKNPKLLK